MGNVPRGVYLEIPGGRAFQRDIPPVPVRGTVAARAANTIWEHSHSIFFSNCSGRKITATEDRVRAVPGSCHHDFLRDAGSLSVPDPAGDPSCPLGDVLGRVAGPECHFGVELVHGRQGRGLPYPMAAMLREQHILHSHYTPACLGERECGGHDKVSGRQCPVPNA